MPDSLSGSVVWWWSTNVNSVYAYGCSFSAACQVAMVKCADRSTPES